MAPKPKARTCLRFDKERLKQLSETLGDRDHIVGDRFTVADLMLTAVLVTADRMQLLADHPTAKADYDRHSSHPAFRTAQEDQIAAFAGNAPRYEGVA